MEPIKPETKQSIIDNGFGTAEEIEEYERLLASRFSSNRNDADSERIAYLYTKLFPKDE